MRIPSDLIPRDEPRDRTGEPLYTLPAGLLALGWLGVMVLSTGGWWVAARFMTIEPDAVVWGSIGGALSGAIGGLGLLVLAPWKPRRSGDLPTLWMGVTTGRLLATPAVAFLLYSAAHPPDRPYVFGIAAAAFLLLVVEVPIIARAMLSQLADEEARAAASAASTPAPSDGASSDASSSV